MRSSFSSGRPALNFCRHGGLQITMSNVWTNGTFDCCSNMGNCCCGTFCWPCQVYSNAEKLEESGILCCLLGCVLPCIPVFMLRSKTREKFDIEGNTMEDAGCSFCCTCCASVQTANELDAPHAN